MTATDIENFASAVGEFIDALASFRKTVGYQGMIAGMQAANAMRERRDESPAYGEPAFYEAAKEWGFAE